MRRRLTVTMILLVFGALLLSGVVGLAVAVNGSRNQTRDELVHEAQGLAVTLQNEATARANPATALKSLLTALQRPMRLEGAAVIGVRRTGTFFDPTAPRNAAQLPSGVTQADVHPVDLLAGKTDSGVHGSVVYAAAPFRAELQILGAPRTVVQAVVLSSKPPSGLAQAEVWFAISSVVILALAGVVAYRLGRRFVKPLRAVEAVTRRIAGGDLDARVPDPPRGDPELQSLSASVNSMAGSLARAKGAERQFLQSVSHDLRTPLTSIRGFAEALEDGTAADVPRAAGVIASEARRLERLVADLLSLATVEARRFTLRPEQLDLAEAAVEIATGFAPAATDLGVTLSVEQPPAPVRVTADPDRLAQVTANLIENALRYARSEVRIAAVANAVNPELWIVDDGPGIEPADLPHVFGRFFTSGDRPGRPASTGLGLAIVAELVSAMGGTVRAESPAGAGGGTKIVVALPPPTRAPLAAPA